MKDPQIGANQCPHGQLSRVCRECELETELAALREHHDSRVDQITDIYRALGGKGEWGDQCPPIPPPDSGDLGEDAKALAAALREQLATHGIHTCHEHCQRPLCVVTRERDALDAKLARVREIAGPAVKAIAESSDEDGRIPTVGIIALTLAMKAVMREVGCE